MIPNATVETFRKVTAETLQISESVGEERFDMKMRSCFGVSIVICTHLWNVLRLDRLLPPKTQYKHLLWALSFLKTGATEEHLSTMFFCDVKTYRKWIWEVILAISRYEAVSIII